MFVPNQNLKKISLRTLLKHSLKERIGKARHYRQRGISKLFISSLLQLLCIRKKVFPYPMKIFYKNLLNYIADFRTLKNFKVLYYLKLRNFKSIALYYPLSYEVDTSKIAGWLHKKGKQLMLPVYRQGDHVLSFRDWLWAEKESTNFKIQDLHNSSIVGKKVRIPEVIILPLIGVNDNGYRLGQGAGYYDKTISQDQYKNTILVGLARSWQQVRTSFNDPWDCKLHYLVTEKSLQFFHTHKSLR